MSARVRNLTERRDFGGIVIVALVCAAVAVKLAMNFASGGAAYAPAPAVAAQAPIHLSGAGTTNSAPFSLVGGDYAISWSATPDSSYPVGCYHGAYLTSTSGDYDESLVRSSLDAGQTKSGTAYAYHVAAGSYYITAISGCAWAFDIR
jgi:hypothetical protein